MYVCFWTQSLHYLSLADVLRFDSYPLSVSCRPNGLNILLENEPWEQEKPMRFQVLSQRNPPLPCNPVRMPDAGSRRSFGAFGAQY